MRVRPPLLLIIAAAITFLGLVWNLAGYPLLDPDEGRNAEIAREMAETNDYVLPHLNGLPYVDKPVLFFAAAAVSIEIFGANEFAVRLPPLLFTLATLGVIAWFATRLFGPTAGWVAAIATGSMPLTLAFARTVIFDSLLTLFVVTSLVAFYQAVETATERSGWWATVGWAAIALGLLTKGPIALAVPLLVMLPYAMWRRRARVVGDPVAILLCVALLLPWVAAVARRVPEFVEYALVTETFKRLTTEELQRTGPFWYFLPILAAGSLPWCLVAISGSWSTRGERDHGTPRDPRIVFLLIWIVAPLILFTLSQSKRPQYMVPIIPAVGLLAGYYWRDAARAAGARLTAALLVVPLAIVASAPFVVPRLLDVEPDVLAAIPQTAAVLGGATALSVALLWVARNRVPLAVVAACLPVAAIPFASTQLMDAIGRDRSAAGLAEAIRPRLSDATQIVAVHTFPLSLPFYLHRRVVLSSTDAHELTSNYLVRYPQVWQSGFESPVRNPDWWMDALIECTRPRVFIIDRANDSDRQLLGQRLPLIGENTRVAAYGPCVVTDLASATRPPSS
jgi:4-amino-4-deoxy-L-arabinose transferase-like glycosyltransferase